MTRSEAVARLEKLAADLEGDVQAAQTRTAHIAMSQRLADTRRLVADLKATEHADAVA